MGEHYICKLCGRTLSGYECYEYRGAYACADHFDQVCKLRDKERDEITGAERLKTAPFEGLDLSSGNPIGRANRKILARHLDVVQKESLKIHRYERGEDEDG